MHPTSTQLARLLLIFVLAHAGRVPAAWCDEGPGAVSEAPSTARPAPPDRPLGIWVLAEGSQRVLEQPERLPVLLADAHALGVTDLFVQVYRRGVAWWPSERIAPADSYRDSQAARGPDAGDPLAALLIAAHGAGLRVHAWVNVLSLADNREAAILTALGPDALQTDRKGRVILSYPELEMPEPEAATLRMGTPAVWVDPAAPGVAAWHGLLAAELFGRYPALDGLHLDYVRYPDVLPFAPGSRFGVGMDFGYGEATRRRFHEATGKKAPFGSALGNANAWDDWRREQLTALVGYMRDAMRAAAPDALLSAAVLPYTDRAYLSVYQDWLGWLEAGLLDFAVPMLYTRDERLLRYQTAAFAGGIAGDRVWAGLGTWLFRRDPARAVAQLRTVERLGVAGRAIFSWDSIVDAPALRAALAAEASRVAGR